jgi:predicted nucleic acid-binding protein
VLHARPRDMRPHGLGVSIVSHGELHEGAFGHADAGVELAELRSFLDQSETLPLTDPIMEIFGRTRSRLRRAGQLIPISTSSSAQPLSITI